MIHYLTLGILLGGSAGLSPGPLTALVISETLEHDIRAGIKVAIAPLVTDPPIILLAVFILSRLSGVEPALGVISIVGGGVVLRMGIDSMKIQPREVDGQKAMPRSLSKGILVNFLSPHPYLFWLSVGGPMIARAAHEAGAGASVFFLGGFYCFLVGSKMFLAILSGRFKAVLSGRLYLFIMRFLGALLCLLAVFLFRDGLRLLGVI